MSISYFIRWLRYEHRNAIMRGFLEGLEFFGGTFLYRLHGEFWASQNPRFPWVGVFSQVSIASFVRSEHVAPVIRSPHLPSLSLHVYTAWFLLWFSLNSPTLIGKNELRCEQCYRLACEMKLPHSISCHPAWRPVSLTCEPIDGAA